MYLFLLLFQANQGNRHYHVHPSYQASQQFLKDYFFSLYILTKNVFKTHVYLQNGIWLILVLELRHNLVSINKKYFLVEFDT